MTEEAELCCCNDCNDPTCQRRSGVSDWWIWPALTVRRTVGTAWDHMLLQSDRFCMQAWAVNTLSRRWPRVRHSPQLISEDYLRRNPLLSC